MKSLSSVVVLVLLVFASSASGGVLPGFRVQTIAPALGFVSSLVVDSTNTIYYSTTGGTIFRLEGENSIAVATLPTHAGGNGGLLGMALLDDRTAVVHYTTWDDVSDRVLDDVIATVDLFTGYDAPLHIFPCDIQNRDRGVSSEHHGGNPTVAPDGSIFVAIGEYGGGIIASVPEWNGGKIWRLWRDGRVEQWSRGVRNPYDLAFDPDTQRVIVADNGPDDGDEINLAPAGSYLGWPFTFGFQPPIDNALPPSYVFPHTIAPTGLHRLSGRNAALPRGILLGGFVAQAIYYFPDVDAQPLPAPIVLADELPSPVLDVTEGPDGRIYFATAGAIARLDVPKRGDCNGDGLTNAADIRSLLLELADGDPEPVRDAGLGANNGSWGCDADGDAIISESDLTALSAMVPPSRSRAVRTR
ncbi:MAG TPA: PQQ-dependent sugar dehydrogenase [Thermoanaerobaculia bacterium]|nr:PQQ-dependent sugar dehydrogenase [Thermoanaerobaculia bacterium]